MKAVSKLTPLITHRFENASSPVWAGQNGAEKAAFNVVFSAPVFGRLMVDDTRKRIKKFAFSYENGLVWTGENKPKTGEAKTLLRFGWDENGYI